jgi:hypothetical protein
MFKELNKYKTRLLRQKIKTCIGKGIPISKTDEQEIFCTPFIEDSSEGVKVFLLPPPKEPLLPSKYVMMLRNQLKDDVFPLVNTKGNAPFNVLRTTFCYLDHVAALRYGKKGHTGDLQKLFSDFGAYSFIKKLYILYHQDLIQLYRHDLIHFTQPLPKIRRIDIESNVKVVYWLTAGNLPKEIEKLTKGKTIESCFDDLSKMMRVENTRKDLFHLRLASDSGYELWVNTWCLFFDLVIYLEDYANLLEKNNEEKKSFLINYIHSFADSLFEGLKYPPLKTVGNKAVISGF